VNKGKVAMASSNLIGDDITVWMAHDGMKKECTLTRKLNDNVVGI